MKKNIAYILLLAACTLAACAKEDRLTPSGLDINWYELSDSDNAVNHLRYQIWQDTGMPVFCNDTIGSQERGYNTLGEAIVYYEVLDPDYAITGNTGATHYTLCEDETQLIAGLEFLRDRVLAALPAKIAPRCYLLVDELFPVKDKDTYQADAVKGMMTTVVGRLGTLGSMSDTEKTHFAASILAEEYASYIYQNCDADLEEFYAYSDVLSQDGATAITVYGYNMSAYTAGKDSSKPAFLPYQDYGFLDYDHSATYTATGNYATYTTVGRQQDIADFVTEVLVGDDDAFQTTYAAYATILAKYQLMKTLLASVRTTLAE